MFIEAPINYPVAVLLDFLLGTHALTLYRREELLTLISMHTSPSSPSSHSGDSSGYAPLEEREGEEKGGLREVEVEVVREVLGLGGRTAAEAVREKGQTYCVRDGMRVCEVDLKEVRLAFTFFFVSTEPIRRDLNT
jgi:hypothetical protein